MQDEIFPDEDDFGRIFRNNAVLSAAGVPQYAAIMGNCVAGGAYLPVLCDKVLMTEDSELYIAGPSLVKAASGQEVDAKALGGARMHAGESGTIDFAEKDDAACLARLRQLVDLLPGPLSRTRERAGGLQVEAAPRTSDQDPHPNPLPSTGEGTRPAHDPTELYALLSPDGSRAYDMRDLLACVVDAGSLLEYK